MAFLVARIGKARPGDELTENLAPVDLIIETHAPSAAHVPCHDNAFRHPPAEDDAPGRRVRYLDAAIPEQTGRADNTNPARSSHEEPSSVLPVRHHGAAVADRPSLTPPATASPRHAPTRTRGAGRGRA